MPMYRYVKKEKTSIQRFLYKNRKKIVKLFPAAFSVIGGLLLVASLGQIVVWQWKYSVGLEKTQIVKPIPNEAKAIDLSRVETKEQNSGSANKTTDPDLILASSWFPKARQQQASGLKADSYKLSIPKLKIKDALVVIGSENLDKNLIHYGGTALPGEFGTGVLFGHSVLPQFFNPTNYKTIFSNLPTLKEGDEVFVNYDGVLYKYVVIGMRVVDPSDISVLEQKYDDSYLGLVTCVPPGTYWKRLFVLTKIVNL